jgi:biopolymer transport protein ExbD
MMDILVVLLLFLLKSFVVEGEAMVPPPGLDLPKSTAEDLPNESIVIAIDEESILLSGERVVSIAEAVASDGLLIEALAERLDSVWEQQETIANLRGAELARERIVTIQGDRDIEFQVLQRVMYTLNHRGFENISLAVIRNA